ncbi:hypothetical protein [Propioniciclava flava]|nr:hypothetical protein [Propioniciclava flava]
MRIVRWIGVLTLAGLAVAWRVHRTRRASEAAAWSAATDRL